MQVTEPLSSTWQASLALGFARRDDSTILARREHRGPLRVQKPLYPEGPGVCHAIVLHPPAGIAGGDLSGGQQQQLAIGRALAFGPRLLILDEPTEGIQPSIIKDIERAIRTLAEEGNMAILLVEQYYDFAESLADQYLVMERGEIIKRGSGKDMAADGVKELLAV